MKIKIFLITLVLNVEKLYSVPTGLIAPIHKGTGSVVQQNQIQHQTPPPQEQHEQSTIDSDINKSKEKTTIEKSKSDKKAIKKNVESAKPDKQTEVKVVIVKPKIARKTVTPKIIQPKVVQPKIVQPKIVAPKPVVTHTTTKTIVKSTQTNLSSQIYNQFFIVNNGKDSVELNGFVFDYTDPQGGLVQQHYTLDMSHVLQSAKQNKGIMAHVPSLEVPLPGGSKLHGLSALLVQNNLVSVKYQGIPWNPSAASTNILYITSIDGTIWQLDEKSMKAEYANAVKNTDQSADMIDNSDDGIHRITNTVEAVVAGSMLHSEIKNQKKIKKSKSKQGVLNHLV